MKAFKAALALACASALLITAPPAYADYTVKDGGGATQTFKSFISSLIHWPGHVMGGLFGGVPTAVNMTNTGALDITCVAGCASGGNTLGTQGSITAADAATTSTAGQSSVNAVTGTPTAGSVVTYAISGASGGTLTIGGTFVATSQIEASYDNGATFRASSALLRGTNLTTASITGPGAFSVDLNGVTHLRVRATAYTSGTMTVNFTYSTAAGLTKLLNGVKLVDSAGADATDTAHGAVKVNMVAGAASISPFLSDGQPASLSLATPNTSARIALPGAGTTAIISVSTGTANCRFGTSSVTALSGDAAFSAGSTQVRNTGGAADIACISPVATTVSVETGVGSPVGFTNTDFSQAGPVQGTAASGAAVSGSPLYDGCRAATAPPTAVTDGQAVGALCGTEGKRIVLPYAIKELQVRGSSGAVTTTTQTSIIASAGGSLKNYITDLECYNTSATTVTLSFTDSATSVFVVPAGSGFMKTFNVPLATSAATAFQLTASGAVTSVGCSAQGYTGL